MRLLVLLCSMSVACAGAPEAPVAPAPAAPVPPPSPAPAPPAVAPSASPTSSFPALVDAGGWYPIVVLLSPIDTGSTEIWRPTDPDKGEWLVGVAFHSFQAGATQTEHIYMFTDDLAPNEGNAWQDPPPKIQAFSPLMVPYKDFDIDDAPMKHTYKELLECTESKACAPCDGGGSLCFANLLAFEDKDEGVWKTLAQRMGRSTDDVYNTARLEATGTYPTTTSAFSVDSCKRPNGVLHADAEGHGDKASGQMGGGAAHMYLFPDNANADVRLEQVVTTNGYTTVNKHDHDNVAAPATLGDWCDQLADPGQPCHTASNCQLRTITFTYN